ncbi:MAG: asparagine synthase (glutamine-hydrolyzing) [Bacteroidia bacterium]|nr:asparagine synthase (glutamine-hydrolyzing) [Bacteroidia bacterium]
MCGINGIFHFNQNHVEEWHIKKMNEAIQHRGPDNNGIFLQNNVGLGHVRLSIIDLSNAGNQPMFSHDGRFVLIFNGEIYNYQKIKSLLPEYPFKTSSDSEVLIAAYIKWGTQMLEYLEGMFAFAIYDQAQQNLFIARDRLGIKPLYYYKTDNFIVFSSEIRGLLASNLFQAQLDKSKISEFFRLGTVSGQDTLLQNTKSIPPASFAIISERTFDFHSYWEPTLETNNEISYEQCKKDIKTLFMNAVEKRLVADVPFGAFLSGGIDSTAVTAAMSECMSGSVNTFNISFEEKEFSEAYYAKQVAKRYGTKHTEIKLSPTLFLEEIENILNAYDHPSFDGANSYIVSQVTRKAGITMALSGLGGDELFGGYPVFAQLPLIINKLGKVPTIVRKCGSTLLSFNQNTRYKKLYELLSMNTLHPAQAYETLRSMLSKSDCNYLLGSYQPIVSESFFNNSFERYRQLTQAELHYYLQPVLLRDTDQMSMRHALEVRVPFLDHKLVEYVLNTPDAYKTKSKAQKSLLVESLSDLLPLEIIQRKKMGFVLPWDKWLRNELSEYVQNAIHKLAYRELLHAQSWQSAFNDFKIGKQNHHWNIFWGLIVLTNWLDRNNIK